MTETSEYQLEKKLRAAADEVHRYERLIRGIHMTPKKMRAKRLKEHQGKRREAYAVYLDVKEEFETFTHFPPKT